jgi:hypothetical protein
VNPTRLRDLVLAALVTGLLAAGLCTVVYDDLPPLPYTFAASVSVLAVSELFLAPSIRARLDGRPRTKPIMPIAVARTAALAKASSLLGALSTGAWLGVLAYLAARLELRAARPDAVVAGVSALCSLVLVVAALRLEGVCRKKDPPPAVAGP